MHDENYWKNLRKPPKTLEGVPRLGRWYSRDDLITADPDQLLVHGVQVPSIVPMIRKVIQRSKTEYNKAQISGKRQHRLILPDQTSRLRISKTRFFELISIVPLLYEFERKCQLANLMCNIGLEIDFNLLDSATSKPDYERLEMLGDTYLKLDVTRYLYEVERALSCESWCLN